MSKAWHEPRPIEDLPKHDDERPPELGPGDSILVYNPCDGWHLLWLMSWRLEDIHAQRAFTHWMPGPPEPPGLDYAAWLAASRKEAAALPRSHTSA